jgi:hypothetical protein
MEISQQGEEDGHKRKAVESGTSRPTKQAKIASTKVSESLPWDKQKAFTSEEEFKKAQARYRNRYEEDKRKRSAESQRRGGEKEEEGGRS